MQANLKASLAILEADIAPVDVSVCCCTSSSVPSASTQWRQNNKHDHTGTSPVNMPDPIRKRFGYGQLWPLRPACSQNRARRYAGSDFPHPFQFRFSKEGMGHTVQNLPGSDPDGLAGVWLNSSGLEASWCQCRNQRVRFLAGRNRPATGYPLLDSVPFFHRRPG